MSLWLTIEVALTALAANKLRAGLTVLGVVIGIAAVTTMVSLGESVSQLVASQFTQLGTNVIVVFPGRMNRPGMQSNVTTLTSDDADAIADECGSVLATSPIVGAAGQVIFGNANYSPQDMFGVGVDYPIVRNWPLRKGGFFTARDVTSANKVCVIGKTVAEKVFLTADPIGQTIRIKNIPLRVIGVLEAKGANMVGADQDNIVLIPFTTVRKRLQGSEFNNVNAILVSAKSSESMPDAVAEINNLLLERHRIHAGEQTDFIVQNTTEIANVMTLVTGTLTLMVAAVASISLFVGGVGIMNIMLVSVTERTREIGIRMAVGATGSDILRQFLAEAIILSGLGGMVGFALGVGAAVGITNIINSITTGMHWPVVISLWAGILALVFSAAVGVFFGYYPARLASQLDPIDALRYE